MDLNGIKVPQVGKGFFISTLDFFAQSALKNSEALFAPAHSD
jgi:hypothetical protein